MSHTKVITFGASAGLCTETAQSISNTLFVIRKAAETPMGRSAEAAAVVFDKTSLQHVSAALKILPCLDETGYQPAGRDIVLVKGLSDYLKRAEEEIGKRGATQEAVIKATQRLSLYGQTKDHYGSGLSLQSNTYGDRKTYSLEEVLTAIRRDGLILRALVAVHSKS